MPALSRGDADAEGAVGQHIVYASPGTFAAFRKTGRFSDGTVLMRITGADADLAAREKFFEPRLIAGEPCADIRDENGGTMGSQQVDADR